MFSDQTENLELFFDFIEKKIPKYFNGNKE